MDKGRWDCCFSAGIKHGLRLCIQMTEEQHSGGIGEEFGPGGVKPGKEVESKRGKRSIEHEWRAGPEERLEVFGGAAPSAALRLHHGLQSIMNNHRQPMNGD